MKDGFANWIGAGATAALADRFRTTQDAVLGRTKLGHVLKDTLLAISHVADGLLKLGESEEAKEAFPPGY